MMGMCFLTPSKAVSFLAPMAAAAGWPAHMGWLAAHHRHAHDAEGHTLLVLRYLMRSKRMQVLHTYAWPWPTGIAST